MKTLKELGEALKQEYVEKFHNFLSGEGEEVLLVGSNELAIPVVDAEGNERWLVLVVKMPTGERGGDGYDGYSLAEDYKMKQEKKAQKKAEKDAKAAKDKAKREAAKPKT